MVSIEDMASFCKKKGFVFPHADVYGGLSGFWDLGPLGVELSSRIKAEWWDEFVRRRDDVVGIDGAVVNHQRIWEASGHVENFADVMVECSSCHVRVRGDQLLEDVLKHSADGMNASQITAVIVEHKIPCQSCTKGRYSAGKQFNLMLQTHVGAVSDNSTVAYLRPETAQLMFTNFKLVADAARLKLPFGIAQIGKAYRNEIAPRDFLFRVREMEQMELEYFIHPDYITNCPMFEDVQGVEIQILTVADKEAGKEHSTRSIHTLVKDGLASPWHAYWIGIMHHWFVQLGINPKNLRVREHLKDELAHYAKACFDIEYKFPFGWKELQGNADRQQFDLDQHMKAAKKDLSLFDEASGEKVVPYVAAEPALGVGRAFLALLFDAYNDDTERGNIVLTLHPKLAPIQVAVFPLVNKLKSEARELFDQVRKEFVCQFDTSGSVGRRYARADEIGVLICITFDFESIDDKKVTLRDRNTTKQIRVALSDVSTEVRKVLANDYSSFL